MATNFEYRHANHFPAVVVVVVVVVVSNVSVDVPLNQCLAILGFLVGSCFDWHDVDGIGRFPVLVGLPILVVFTIDTCTSKCKW